MFGWFVASWKFAKANCSLDTSQIQNHKNKIIWQFHEENDTEIITILLFQSDEPTNSTHFKWSTTKRKLYFTTECMYLEEINNKENETENFNHLSLSHIWNDKPIMHTIHSYLHLIFILNCHTSADQPKRKMKLHYQTDYTDNTDTPKEEKAHKQNNGDHVEKRLNCKENLSYIDEWIPFDILMDNININSIPNKWNERKRRKDQQKKIVKTAPWRYLNNIQKPSKTITQHKNKAKKIIFS